MTFKNRANRFSLLVYSVLCINFLLFGCTLRLKDSNAPSVGFDLETDYDLLRWGDQEKGFAPTQPELKEKGASHSGGGIRVRANFSNTFTWTNPEGSFSEDYTLNGTTHNEYTPLEAKGWKYRGGFTLMPGFSLLGDRIFIAGLVGIEASYMELKLKNKNEPGNSSWMWTSDFGIPIGLHVECTIARVLTPSLTYAYVQNVGTWGGFAGSDSTIQLNLRLWPGSFVPALGSHLWVDGGWLSSNSMGLSSTTPLFNRDIEISGPYFGMGLRF